MQSTSLFTYFYLVFIVLFPLPLSPLLPLRSQVRCVFSPCDVRAESCEPHGGKCWFLELSVRTQPTCSLPSGAFRGSSGQRRSALSESAAFPQVSREPWDTPLPGPSTEPCTALAVRKRWRTPAGVRRAPVVCDGSPAAADERGVRGRGLS